MSAEVASSAATSIDRRTIADRIALARAHGGGPDKAAGAGEDGTTPTLGLRVTNCTRRSLQLYACRRGDNAVPTNRVRTTDDHLHAITSVAVLVKLYKTERPRERGAVWCPRPIGIAVPDAFRPTVERATSALRHACDDRTTRDRA